MFVMFARTQSYFKRDGDYKWRDESFDEYFLWYHYESRTEKVSMSNEISHTLPLHAKKPKVLNFFTVSVWFEVIQYSFAPVSEDFLLQFLTDWTIFAGNFSGLLNM